MSHDPVNNIPPLLLSNCVRAAPCANYKFASAIISVLKGFRAKILGKDYSVYPTLSATDESVNENAICKILTQEWWIPIQTSSTNDLPYSLNLSITDTKTENANIIMHAENDACKSLEVSIKTSNQCKQVAADMRNILRVADKICRNLSKWIHIGDRCDIMFITQGDIRCYIYFPRTTPLTGNMMSVVLREDPLKMLSLHSLDTVMRAHSYMENTRKNEKVQPHNTATVQQPSSEIISEQQITLDIPADQSNIQNAPIAPAAAIEDEDHLTSGLPLSTTDLKILAQHENVIVIERTSQLGYCERVALRDLALNSDTPVATVESSDA